MGKLQGLPGPLRAGFIQKVKGRFIIHLDDNKGDRGEPKDVPFDSEGYSELDIGRRCGHLLLVQGKGRRKSSYRPVEEGEPIVCLLSKSDRPLKAHRWAFWDESTIRQWANRKAGERFKKRARQRAVENTYP